MADAGRDLARFFGIGALDATGSGQLIDLAGPIGRLTHFCGFQRGAGAIVGLIEFVWPRESRANAPLQADRPLIGYLQRGDAQSFGIVPAARAGAAAATGCDPLGPARSLTTTVAQTPTGISEKVRLGKSRIRFYFRSIPWLLVTAFGQWAEVFQERMGSGVRVARDVALAGREARHRNQNLPNRVGVQSAWSLALVLAGVGKLFGGSGIVNRT